MARIAGIKYETNTLGRTTGVHINLDRFKTGNNQLSEMVDDLLDLLAIEAGKDDEPGEPLDDVMRAEYKRRGLKYEL
jgi:hypothetical protein